MHHVRLFTIVSIVLFCVACSEDAPVASTSAAEQTTTADQNPATVESKIVNASQGRGGVAVRILPEKPTANDCLNTIMEGTPGSNAVIWKINEKIVATGTDGRFCQGGYQRGDQVTVEVGTIDQGASYTTTIENSPPLVTDISSTPAEIFAGNDIKVVPIAEDADGDSVDFKYQWLINGVVDPLQTQATLPGDRFTKGDTVQVLIVPNDFYDDGPTYQSFAQPVPNAAPRITSQPPQGIASLNYRYQVEVSDPDDSRFEFRLEEAPEGMTIDADSGLLQWSLVEAKPGDHTIVIIVSDPDGAEAAQEYVLTLAASE